MADKGIVEQRLVRVVVGILIIGALAFALLLDPPDDLPAVALGKEFLYRVEILLLVFYGGLLLLTPLFYGLVRGKLPIEVSARGAKFAEEAADSIAATQDQSKELEGDMRSVQRKLVRARLNLDQIAAESEIELQD